ncbi:FHA domain-containing protein [Thalassoroseus pseudoceratinae]|uniref:FHA domain-containing protein n=1 Tax=Thalassoroseus pseudoceratinae TaxID=2713176 RepID=UPI00141DE640|nr:FHA domain-containing protein [Thalassoroseus pseudoceratinae]
MYKVRLKAIGGKHDGRTIAVKKNKFLIGREQDCHLRPKTDLVSRHHCVFSIDDYGVRLRDLSSRNGTFVNGTQLTEDRKLEHGDKVSFAGLDFWMIIKEVESDELQQSTPSMEPSEFSEGADASEQTAEMPIPQLPEGGDPNQFQPQPQQPGMPMSAEGQPMPPWPGYGMQQPPGGYPQQMPPWGYPPQQMPPWGYPPQQMPGYPPQQYPYPQQGYPEQPPVEEEEPESDEMELDIRLPDPDETGAVEEEQKSDAGPPPEREGKTPAELAAEMLKKGRRGGG